MTPADSVRRLEMQNFRYRSFVLTNASERPDWHYSLAPTSIEMEGTIIACQRVGVLGGPPQAVKILCIFFKPKMGIKQIEQFSDIIQSHPSYGSLES